MIGRPLSAEMSDRDAEVFEMGRRAGRSERKTQVLKQPANSVDLQARPQNPWVFKTLSASGWDYEGNPILMVVTLEIVKEDGTGKLRGSNLIFDFVDPKRPSRRVAVTTESAIEILDVVKAAYTMEMMADEGKGKK